MPNGRRLEHPLLAVLQGKGGAERERSPHAGGRVPKNMLARAPAFSMPTDVLDTVDFTAEEGLLWHPVSMKSIVCPEGEEDCDAVVRFCLIHIDEYQANPWKYPMAAMLQKRSQCMSPDNSRAYRLSTLRVSRLFLLRGGCVFLLLDFFAVFFFLRRGFKF